MAQTFFVDAGLAEALRLDAILTVVDALHVERHLDEERADGAVNEAVQQVAFADKILVGGCGWWVVGGLFYSRFMGAP